MSRIALDLIGQYLDTTERYRTMTLEQLLAERRKLVSQEEGTPMTLFSSIHREIGLRERLEEAEGVQ